MHLTDLNAGFIGATPIVGSTIPIAVGVALASRMRGENGIVAVFFGDGATETGVFHESLNFAVLKRLPVLFVCENNLYSVYSPMKVRQPACRTIVQLAAAHGLRTERGDGNDVETIWRHACDTVAQIRSGNGPVLLEFLTYRWREHCGPNFDNDIGYRTVEEYETWRQRDPIVICGKRLVDEGVVSKKDMRKEEERIHLEIDDAVAFAKSSAFPTSENCMTQVYA